MEWATATASRPILRRLVTRSPTAGSPAGVTSDLVVLAGWRSDDMLSRYAIEGLAAAHSSRANSGEAAKRLLLQLADLRVSVDTEHQIRLREDTPEHMLDPGLTTHREPIRVRPTDPGPVLPYGSQSAE